MTSKNENGFFFLMPSLNLKLHLETRWISATLIYQFNTFLSIPLLPQQRYTAGCLLSHPDLVAKLPRYLVKPALPPYRSAHLQTRLSALYVTFPAPPPVKTTQPPHPKFPAFQSPHPPHSFQTHCSPVVPRSVPLTSRYLRLAPHHLLLQRSLHISLSRKVRGRLMCRLHSRRSPSLTLSSLALLTMCICNFPLPL